MRLALLLLSPFYRERNKTREVSKGIFTKDGCFKVYNALVSKFFENIFKESFAISPVFMTPFSFTRWKTRLL
jgi:hypothetical protein